jgi:hypothetical protein
VNVLENEDAARMFEEERSRRAGYYDRASSLSLCEAKYKAMEGVSTNLTSTMLGRTACARFRSELSLGSHFREEVYFGLRGLACAILITQCRV